MPAEVKRMLQVCPHDTPPFGDLCEAITQAAVMANIDITTIILGSPVATPRPGFVYLGSDNPRAAGEVLQADRNFNNPNKPWHLVLCHRYGAFRAARRLKVPRRRLVVIAHEFNLLKRWQRRLYRFFLGRRVRYGGVSPAVGTELARHTGMSLVLPNILDLELFDQRLLSREDAMAKLSLDAHSLTIAVVGRIHYKKRPRLALKVWQAFRRNHEQARLVFVGDGDAEVKQELIDAGAIVTGQIERASSALAAFDVLLHTGDVEGFGMVILEAMAAGVPVVAVAGGGPEYVLGKLGCYPQTDTVEGYAAALEQAHLLDRGAYKSAARERCEQKFSTASMANMLPNLIEFVREPETDPFKPIF